MELHTTENPRAGTPACPRRRAAPGAAAVRVAALVALATLAAGRAAEPWFLPCEADDATLVLARFEDDAVLGSLGGELTLCDNAERTPGRFGQGVRFADGTQHLRIDSSDGIRFGRHDPFTVEMWTRPADSSGGALWCLAVRYYLHCGAKTQFGYRAASFPIRYCGTPGLKLKPGRWSHVALTHDADRTVRLYVNGELVEQVQHADEGDYAKGQARLTVGAHDGWTNFFRGEVDEVRISRGVRSYEPVLAGRFLLQGEALRLRLPPREYPPSVAGAVVTVRRGKQEIHKATVKREELDRDLIAVDALPPGWSEVEIVFTATDGAPLTTVRTAVENAIERQAEMLSRLAPLRQTAAAPAASGAPDSGRVLGLYIREIEARLSARRFEDATRRLAAAERVAAALNSGEAAYRASLRRHVRARPLPQDVRISVSWEGAPGDAFRWAERLGANELIAHGHDARARLERWKNAGFHTVLLGSAPIHDGAWLRDHPENRQRGYWVSKPAKADGSSVTIRFKLPTWSAYEPDRNDAKRWWKVVDSRGAAIPADAWTVDPKRPEVTVLNAVAGESYRVYYTFRAPTFLDPLAPGSLERAIANLTEKLSPLRGVLDAYWADDIGYGYPGPTEHASWDWESYTLAAGTTQVEAFQEDSGIAFDPAWLVCLPRTIVAVPAPEYLAWMRWVRDRLKGFIAAHTKTVADLGLRSWLYWGDCHVGMEPYGGSLERFDEVDKPAADPVTVRALTDFPGPTFRRMRVDWLFPHTGRRPRTAGRMWCKWRDARRALLRQPKVRGLYWMVFDLVAQAPDDDVREDVVETLSGIDDEFRLLTVDIGNVEAFSHDLDVTVLSAWGDNYAWRPWGSPELWHLTHLPVKVRFDSFANVAERGLPGGTDVVFLYGLPGTAWSGGRWWADGKVAAALKEHVKRGGGLTALQAPSALDDAWALSDLLGVRPAGAGAAAPVTINPSELADTADEGVELPPGQEALRLTRAGRDHWLANRVPSGIPGLRDIAPVALEASDATLIAGRVDRKGAVTPGVIARQVGAGRVVYVCGHSVDPGFARLLRNALFWTAGREADASRLDVDGPGALVYAYPAKRLLAMHNGSAEAIRPTVRCDADIFGLGSASALRLVDVVEGQATEATPAALRQGLTLPAPPNAVSLWRIEDKQP